MQKNDKLRIFLVAFIATVTALAIGYWIAQMRIQSRAESMRVDLQTSVDRVMLESRANKGKLSDLAGEHCEDILEKLEPSDLFMPYLRSAIFVHDGTLYCSTIVGPISIPLASYFAPDVRQPWSKVLRQTPLVEGVPTVANYLPVNDRDGILFIVEGKYISDILNKARAAGAKEANIQDAWGESLNADGVFESKPSTQNDGQEHLVSNLEVSIIRDPARDRLDVLVTELATMGAYLTLAVLVWLGYVLGFTPRQRLMRRIQQGLRKKEFFLEYQAIVDTNSGQWVGVETLVRWQHTQLGVISPGRFINAVENTDIIVPLTHFIFEQALTELSALPFPDGFHISINITPRHMHSKEFPYDLISILSRHTRRYQIVMEIVERGLIGQASVIRERMEVLRNFGVKFSVDDFGTESSNIALLQQFSFDCIKIDRQFVEHVADSNRGLVEGMVLLGSNTGATIIAEGVETADQLVALREIGVDMAQGYLFHRPERASRLAERYRRVDGGPAGTHCT